MEFDVVLFEICNIGVFDFVFLFCGEILYLFVNDCVIVVIVGIGIYVNCIVVEIFL